MITAGKDAGQTGVISKVHRDLKKPGVTVKGMNLVCVSVLRIYHCYVSCARRRRSSGNSTVSCKLDWFAVQEAH